METKPINLKSKERMRKLIEQRNQLTAQLTITNQALDGIVEALREAGDIGDGWVLKDIDIGFEPPINTPSTGAE